jgi:DNA replication and repair protein RecF
MRVSRLNISGFRIYPDAFFKPDKSLNVLIGKNAQGKTTLLEAVYMLATSRSWRAGKDHELIKWGYDTARITADIERDEQNNVEIEISLNRTEKKQVKVNTIRQSRLGDLMGQVNIVLIEPHDVEIVRTDPSRRRKFMDIEISQIQPQYCHLIAGYKKILEQRNKLLKDIHYGNMSKSMLDVWTDQLIGYGSRIIERRLHFIQNLKKIAAVIHQEITEDNEHLDIAYVSNIDLNGSESSDEITLKMRQYLDEKRSEELGRGVTLAGPQRDDLLFTINDVDARIYGSQGQQRTIALSLRMAEIDIMEESSKEPPIVLLDDVMTDLDESRRSHVFEMTGGRCQTFITTASSRLFEAEFMSHGSVFNIEDGRISER